MIADTSLPCCGLEDIALPALLRLDLCMRFHSSPQECGAWWLRSRLEHARRLCMSCCPPRPLEEQCLHLAADCDEGGSNRSCCWYQAKKCTSEIQAWSCCRNGSFHSSSRGYCAACSCSKLTVFKELVPKQTLWLHLSCML